MELNIPSNTNCSVVLFKVMIYVQGYAGSWLIIAVAKQVLTALNTKQS